MFLPLSVFLFVCLVLVKVCVSAMWSGLFDSPLDYSKSCERILMNFWRNFQSFWIQILILIHDFLKGFSIYYYDIT